MLKFTDQQILDAHAKCSRLSTDPDDVFYAVCMEVLGYSPLDRILSDLAECDQFEARYNQLIPRQDTSTSTEDFKKAVSSTSPKPKGVIVSLELFKALDAEKSLERKLATPGGLPAPSFGIELPYYDSDVFVGCDPALDGLDFKLPQN